MYQVSPWRMIEPVQVATSSQAPGRARLQGVGQHAPVAQVGRDRVADGGVDVPQQLVAQRSRGVQVEEVELVAVIGEPRVPDPVVFESEVTPLSTLALHAAGGDRLDERPLQRQEEDEHRDGDDREVGHQLAPGVFIWKKKETPTMTGRASSVWVTINGHRYEFQMGRKVRMATVATTGPDSGMMTLR